MTGTILPRCLNNKDLKVNIQSLSLSFLVDVSCPNYPLSFLPSTLPLYLFAFIVTHNEGSATFWNKSQGTHQSHLDGLSHYLAGWGAGGGACHSVYNFLLKFTGCCSLFLESATQVGQEERENKESSCVTRGSSLV